MKLYEDYLELTLSAFKTDPFQQDIIFIMVGIDDEACAIRVLKHLFRQWPADSATPLFEIRAHSSFIRNTIMNVFRQTLRMNNVSNHYLDHSFRCEAVTSTRLADFSNDEIMLLKRWKSDSYRFYIMTHLAHILAASRRYQIVQIYDFEH